LQFALASVIDLTRNFPNADIEMMKRIGFGKHNIVPASPITYVTPDDPPELVERLGILRLDKLFHSI
jgi:hypothetical protein